MHCAKSKSVLSAEQFGYAEVSTNSRVRISSTRVLTLMQLFFIYIFHVQLHFNAYYIFVALFRLRNNSFNDEMIKHLVTKFCRDSNHRIIR